MILILIIIKKALSSFKINIQYSADMTQFIQMALFDLMATGSFQNGYCANITAHAQSTAHLASMSALSFVTWHLLQKIGTGIVIV